MYPISFLSLLFVFIVDKVFASTGCKQVSISTYLKPDGEASCDVMNRGEITDFWSESEEQYKDQDSTELDFLYVTVYGKHDQLTVNNFKIMTNVSQYSNTTLFLEKVVPSLDESYRTYSVRVNYKCNEDIAKPIKLNFKVEGNFQGCHTSNSNIYWTRICGDNEPPRMGLSMVYNIKNKYNFTVVEDGRLVEGDYFSEQYDTYILKIPKRMETSLFYLSLNRSEEIFLHNQVKQEDVEKLYDSDTSDLNDLPVDQLQFAKEQVITGVSVNYDLQVVEVFIKGPLRDGGVINFDPQMIYLQFVCIRGGKTGIQLSVEMNKFKNINVFFEKECPLMSGEGGTNLLSTFAFLVFVALIVILLFTLYNVFALDIQGIKAIPFATSVLTTLSNTPGIKNSSIGRGLYNLGNPTYSKETNDRLNSISQQVSQSERNFQDSEFKIKNITEEEDQQSIIEVSEAEASAGILTSPNYGSIQ